MIILEYLYSNYWTFEEIHFRQVYISSLAFIDTNLFPFTFIVLLFLDSNKRFECISKGLL